MAVITGTQTVFPNKSKASFSFRKERWNKMCDRIDLLIKTANESVAKKRIVDSKIANKIRMFFIHNTPSLYQFISLCNYNNIVVWRMKKREYKFDYQSRQALVYSLAVLNSCFRGKSFLNTYILMSLLFCRENFNFTSYKFALNTPIPNKNKQQ